MRIKLSTEFKVVFYFIITTVVVVVTGILAFHNLNRLTESIQQSKTSEIKMLLLKGINSDMASAESSVKSFALTSETDYLEQYNEVNQSLYQKISSLDSLAVQNKPQHELLTKMTPLIEEKLALLEGYIELEKRGLVINELNSLARKLDERRNKVASEKIAKEEKGGVFKRLFKKKDKKKKEAEEKKRNPEEIKKKQLLLLEEMKKDVNAVKQKQSRTLKTFDTHELNLTQRNKFLSEEIRALVTSMEVIEINEANALVIANEQKHKETNRMIATFSIATCILLVSMGWILYVYLKKRNQYETALIAARNEAENYSAMQEVFLANMSHEVRTPMNAISGFTEQLQHTTLNNQQQTYVDIVRKSVKHLLVIIDDILDYSKLKAGKLRIESINFSPETLVSDVITLMSNQADKKQLHLKFSFEKKLPDALMGDPVRLKQVLINIIGNSIKFTSTGGVKLHAKYASGNLQLTITDTGIGIEKDNIKRIFEAFEQANTSTTRVYGGSGLGLAITKKLVELMNGTIHFSSELNKGTTVQINLPYAIGNGIPEAQQTNMAEVKSLVKGLRILVADDEEWNIKLLQAIFGSLSVQITCVSDGTKAIEEIEAHEFDVALLDMRMPGKDGISVTKSIRGMKDESKSLLPVIILTASANNNHLDACKEAGVNAILIKPFDETLLLEKIIQVTTNTSYIAKRAIGNAFEEQSTPTNNQLSHNLSHLIKLANGDQVFLKEMIKTFARNLNKTIEECAPLIENENFQEVYELVHKIIPPCRFMEAHELVKLFKQLEEDTQSKNKNSALTSLNDIKVAGNNLIQILSKEYTD